eukprot:6187675-Pleurochrysis_carterae.AAC.1
MPRTSAHLSALLELAVEASKWAAAATNEQYGKRDHPRSLLRDGGRAVHLRGNSRRKDDELQIPHSRRVGSISVEAIEVAGCHEAGNILICWEVQDLPIRTGAPNQTQSTETGGRHRVALKTETPEAHPHDSAPFGQVSQQLPLVVTHRVVVFRADLRIVSPQTIDEVPRVVALRVEGPADEEQLRARPHDRVAVE